MAKNGCIVDTSILFSASYGPDVFNTASEELFEFLADLKIPTFTNVNIRSEFIDLHRRVMIPEGLSDLYSDYGKSLDSILYAKLQSVYASLSTARKESKSVTQIAFDLGFDNLSTFYYLWPMRPNRLVNKSYG
jgi:UDP-galactopyranose mutase